MPGHEGKFALTYKGPYMVKKAFSEGAMILANIDGKDFNMPTNSDAVIQYFAWASLWVQPLFLHSYVNRQKKKNTKNMKRWIENPKGRSMQKARKRKSVKEPAILKTRKGDPGKN